MRSNRVAFLPAAAPIPARMRYPFTLGVASGDPLPGSVMLWTRLAPAPEQPDGGMPSAPVHVHWEVARDDSFRHVIQTGMSMARPEFAHSVHVDVRALVPGGVYWYRFHWAGHTSAVGCTRTAPEAHGPCQGVRFAVTSGQNFEDGNYVAYDAIAREDLDFVLFVGSYVSAAAPREGRSRRHSGHAAASTLTDYRLRHAQYKHDPQLQAVHRALPWIVLCPPSSHEVDRRQAELQALWEHMPLRRARLLGCANGDALLPRRFAFGALAELGLTALAAEQPRPVSARGAARSQWNLRIHAQPLDELITMPTSLVGSRLLESLPNTVLLSGSAQESSVALVGSTLHSEPPSFTPQFVASSISTLRGTEKTECQLGTRALFRDERHGYVRCELDRETFRADFLTLPQTARGALSQCASYVVESGCPTPRQD